MTISDIHHTLVRRLAVWSDEVQKQAVALVDRHRDLIPKRITHAQLSGLQNTVRSAPNMQTIRRFLDHQAQRAGRTGRAEIQAWWQEVRKAMDGLGREVEELSSQPGGMVADRVEREALHLQLVREYVQHLVAHCWLVGRKADKREKRIQGRSEPSPSAQGAG